MSSGFATVTDGRIFKSILLDLEPRMLLGHRSQCYTLYSYKYTEANNDMPELLVCVERLLKGKH